MSVSASLTTICSLTLRSHNLFMYLKASPALTHAMDICGNTGITVAFVMTAAPSLIQEEIFAHDGAKF